MELIQENEKSQILSQLSIGLTMKEASLLAKVRDEDARFTMRHSPGFRKQVEWAQLEMKRKALDTISRSMTKYDNAQSAAWYLERKHKDEFGTKTININSENGNTTVVFQMERPRAQEQLTDNNKRPNGKDPDQNNYLPSPTTAE